MRYRALVAVFMLIHVACGDDSSINDAGRDSAPSTDSSPIDAPRDVPSDPGFDGGPAIFDLRFGHFVPDLAADLQFCVSSGGTALGVVPDAPITFRELSERFRFEVSPGGSLLIRATTLDCDSPLFEVTLVDSGRGTVAAVGLADPEQDICGDSYTADCPDSVGARGWYWEDSDETLRFVTLAANSRDVLVCNGAERVAQVAGGAPVESVVVDLHTVDVADWYVIRAALGAECGDESPILTRIVVPTPEEFSSLSERVTRTLTRGTLLVGSGVLRLPYESAADSFEFIPWGE